MPLQLESRHIGGDVVVIKPLVLGDDRGFFMETYRQDNFRDLGLPTDWAQDNHSRSSKGVLRGLHFQWDPPMSKLMRVTHGAAFLVAVDIRKGSPTLGRWYGTELTAESKRQLWAPAGFARGFCVVSDAAEIEYLTTGTYNARGEAGILWDDPAIGITWPVSTPILSDRDRNAPSLSEWLARAESNHFT